MKRVKVQARGDVMEWFDVLAVGVAVGWHWGWALGIGAVGLFHGLWRMAEYFGKGNPTQDREIEAELHKVNEDLVKLCLYWIAAQRTTTPPTEDTNGK